MTQRRELLLLTIGDFIGLNAAWIAFFWLRVDSGWFMFHHTVSHDVSPALLPVTSLEIYLFWMVLFLFFGLYRPWYVRPPFDEIITLLKTLGIGTVLLSLLIWWDPSGTSTLAANDPRILGVIYWGLTAAFCVTIRLGIRFAQRRLLISGIGTRPSIIVGEPAKVRELAERMAHYPQLGYDIIGYVSANGVSPDGSSDITIPSRRGTTGPSKILRRFGSADDLESIIAEHGAQEVLVALGSNEHEKLIEVLSRGTRSNVGLKIVPDLYDIVSGQARTREIHGFPLIDINPVLMRPWEEAAKRTLDIAVSSVVMAAGLPFWLLTALAVKMTSKGSTGAARTRAGGRSPCINFARCSSMRNKAARSGLRRMILASHHSAGSCESHISMKYPNCGTYSRVICRWSGRDQNGSFS